MKMGSKFRWPENVRSSIDNWVSTVKIRGEASKRGSSDADRTQTQLQTHTHKMTQESSEIEEMVVIEKATPPITEFS